jgi:ferric-dicitrate binding protein FerR (iron transport regulator)
MKANTEIWELIGKVLHQEASQQEQQELSAWRSQLPENEKIYAEALKVWEQTGTYLDLEKFDSDNGWKAVASDIKKPKTFRLTLSRIAVAASVMVLVAVAAFWLPLKTNQSNLVTQQTNNVTTLNDIVLPDGTKVSLNVGSNLSFPEEFSGENREVYLTGEAFFLVKHNPQKPFIIHAGESKIRVLGTSFNVNAYPEKDTVEVIVSTGKVEFSTKDAKQLILTKGEKGTLALSNSDLKKSENINPNYAAWMNKTMTFRNTPLGEVVETLRKVYHVNIQFDEEVVNEKEWTVTFHDQSLATVFSIMERTFDIKVEYNDDVYTLTHRNQ